MTKPPTTEPVQLSLDLGGATASEKPPSQDRPPKVLAFVDLATLNIRNLAIGRVKKSGIFAYEELQKR